MWNSLLRVDGSEVYSHNVCEGFGHRETGCIEMYCVTPVLYCTAQIMKGQRERFWRNFSKRQESTPTFGYELFGTYTFWFQ